MGPGHLAQAGGVGIDLRETLRSPGDLPARSAGVDRDPADRDLDPAVVLAGRFVAWIGLSSWRDAGSASARAAHSARARAHKWYYWRAPIGPFEAHRRV